VRHSFSLEDAGDCRSLLSISMSWRLFTQTKSTTGDLQPKSLDPPAAMWCAARSLRRCPSEIVVALLPTARGKACLDPRSSV
jgi:hypothetical protein